MFTTTSNSKATIPFITFVQDSIIPEFCINLSSPFLHLCTGYRKHKTSQVSISKLEHLVTFRNKCIASTNRLRYFLGLLVCLQLFKRLIESRSKMFFKTIRIHQYYVFMLAVKRTSIGNNCLPYSKSSRYIFYFSTNVVGVGLPAGFDLEMHCIRDWTGYHLKVS